MTLTFTETGDNVERNTVRGHVQLPALTMSTIMKDGANNTFYAVVPASNAQVSDSNGDGIGEWTATFTVSKDYSLARRRPVRLHHLHLSKRRTPN